MEIRQAAVIVPLRVRERLEVYIVRRAPELAFLGGFHTFPGGSLDPVDEALAHDGLVSDVRVSAAQRELFEELGVLTGALATVDTDRQSLRQRVLDDPSAWGEWITCQGGIDHRHLKKFGRWVTPAFSPIRFEAQYFAATIPDSETPDVWPGENTEGAWWTVRGALDAHTAGELFISYPVLETLKVIDECDGNVDQAAEILEARDTEEESGGGGEMLAGVRVRPVLTPTLPPAKHTNVYILGRDELVVVDPATPFPDEQRGLIAYLERLEARGERIREIWLTHHHPDHTGAVGALRERFSVPVAAHRLCAEDLAGRVVVDRFIEDQELTVFTGRDGTEDRWRALHTPGHARGHLCFYEERAGTLVSGDLVVSVGTVVIAAPDGDMTDYFASLRRVRNLPKHGFLLPAHGHPLATTLAKIDEYIAHRTAREESIFETLEVARSALEIVPILYADVPQQVWPLAAASVESHLVKLEGEGRVQREGDRWSRS